MTDTAKEVVLNGVVVGGIEKSSSIKNLAMALSEFQGSVDAISKDSSNPFFKSKYASLENIVTSIRPILKENGLAVSQLPVGDNQLTTMLMHRTGEYLCSTVRMTPKDNTPQGQGSAITYMRRYALSAVLGIVTDEDDDGNAATQPKKVVATPVKPTPKPIEATVEPIIDLDEDLDGAAKELMDTGIDIDGLGHLPPNPLHKAPEADPLGTLECHEGGEVISKAEYDFSMKRYGRPLCREHQKAVRPL